MDYFSILDLEREPFSNSPDPDFFYGSRQHLECLQKLELALRLRRGLNVIIGDVGTGKTTLCRQLIRRFSGSEDFETHLILDPHFTGSREFLVTVARMLSVSKISPKNNDWQLKEFIKQYLFQRGVDEKKTVILIIDEGQKLPIPCLELLREFLNYETNEYKLLQIVIFAQNEFERTVSSYANFADRINLYHHLQPMNFSDSRAMIHYRLEKSSRSLKSYTFFSTPALLAIYLATGGYPRKIINLCHRCILTMIIQNRNVVDMFLVRTCSKRVFPKKSSRPRKIAMAAVTALLLLGIGLAALHFLQPGLPLPKQLFASRSAQTVESQSDYRKIPPQPRPAAEPSAEEPAAAPPASAVSTAETLALPGYSSRIETDSPPAQDETTSAPMPAGGDAAGPNAYQGTLGKVTIEENETLSGIIERVYGNFNSKYFKSLILANPQIDDPDVINVGQTIVLPAIPVDVLPLKSSAWWIRVARMGSLEDAYRFLRSMPRNAPPIRLVSYWSPVEGMHFALLLERYYTNPAAARKGLQQLPGRYAQNGEVLSIWSKDTVFFADPFFGRRGNRG